MNTSDTEIVRAVLSDAGYAETSTQDDADVLLLNTCAIREKAETKIWTRLSEIRAKNRKKKKDDRQTVAVLGCMAERLKERLLERADVVAGPDAYRDLPSLIDVVSGGEASAAFNVQLSTEETYGDIRPVRDNHSSVSAFTSIQRGCNNVCSFCIVPHTRGRERSRSLVSIRDEVLRLAENGYREVTLLGQNVNSYFDRTDDSSSSSATKSETAKGFSNMYTLREEAGIDLRIFLKPLRRSIRRCEFVSHHLIRKISAMTFWKSFRSIRTSFEDCIFPHRVDRAKC